MPPSIGQKDSPAVALRDPVSRLPGVGSARSAMLRGEGIETVYDLLTMIPKRYEDRTRFSTVVDLRGGERSLLLLSVVSSRLIRTRRRDFTILEAFLRDDTGTCKAVWFNRPYLAKSLLPDRRMVVHGAPTEKSEALVLDNPDYELCDPEDTGRESVHFGRIVPIYRRLSSLSGKGIRKLIADVLPIISGDEGLARALADLHFPPTIEDAARARKDLARRELLTFQTGLALLKLARGAAPSRAPLPGASLDRIVAFAPFTPTVGQRDALARILEDLGRPHPMARLLHGEVGSGKTMVALLSAIPVMEAGRQVALLAPTEVLVEQLHQAALHTLAPAGLAPHVALLSASVKGQARNQKLLSIARGGPRLVVGTHALFQEGVHFRSLCYVIVDEQHRFGVFERGALMAKAPTLPDLLVMSATPIPRTLTLTIYGDLDVTRIAEVPPGRAPVSTRVLPWDERRVAFDALAAAVAASEQGFVVVPLIEEDRSGGAEPKSSVTTLAKSLREKRPTWRIAVLHGRMPPDEKAAVGAAFRAGDGDVLVATTVVEVGIDVPRATVMIVMGAESFGLSQLHQLRGRIGRSTFPGQCHFVLSRGVKGEPLARLKVLESLSDGFRLAEEDWKSRGPGEVAGARQWGKGSFRVADLVIDGDLIEEARAEAFRTAEKLPEAERARYLEAWQIRFGVARVG